MCTINALIIDVDIRCEDSGALVARMVLRSSIFTRESRTVLYDGSSNSIYVGQWIIEFLDVIGARSIRDAIGRAVRLRVDGDNVTGIGHIVDDEWIHCIVEKDSTAEGGKTNSGTAAEGE